MVFSQKVVDFLQRRLRQGKNGKENPVKPKGITGCQRHGIFAETAPRFKKGYFFFRVNLWQSLHISSTLFAGLFALWQSSQFTAP